MNGNYNYFLRLNRNNINPGSHLNTPLLQDEEQANLRKSRPLGHEIRVNASFRYEGQINPLHADQDYNESIRAEHSLPVLQSVKSSNHFGPSSSTSKPASQPPSGQPAYPQSNRGAAAEEPTASTHPEPRPNIRGAAAEEPTSSTHPEPRPTIRGAAAEEPTASTHPEPRPSIQQPTIPPDTFIQQIEPFKRSQSEFHGQLIRLFNNDPSLSRLDLGLHKIGDAGAEALAHALQHNSSLMELVLSSNQIGDEGAKALAHALQTNSSLGCLNLFGNQIGAEGAKALADALQTNSSLRKLDLALNKIGDAGAQALAYALVTNKTLRILDLRSNYIVNDGAKAFASALETNSSLMELGLNSNYIGNDGAQALAHVLQTNSSLRKLVLSSNQIRDAGAKSFEDALQTNSSLCWLSLFGNKIGGVGAQGAIAKVTDINRAIYYNNTKALKSTIVHTARALAKISPETAPKAEQSLAAKWSSIPDRAIAKITEFTVVSIASHNLTEEQKEKLTLNAVMDGRKKEQAESARRNAQRDTERKKEREELEQLHSALQETHSKKNSSCSVS